MARYNLSIDLAEEGQIDAARKARAPGAGGLEKSIRRVRWQFHLTLGG